MKYGYWIDQAFCLRVGINGNEGAVYNTLRELPSWAESANIEGKTFFFAARGQLCKMLPLVTEKPDTMYRHYKKLEGLGLIETTKIGGKDYVHIVPEFSKQWGTSDYSEKNPKTLGKFSDILVNKNNTKEPPISPTGGQELFGDSSTPGEAPPASVETGDNQGEAAARDYDLEFDAFRKTYPGIKDGNSTEYSRFLRSLTGRNSKTSKRPKLDIEETLPKLSEALARQKQWRVQAAQKGEFMPGWKNLSTWINNRCWEEEPPCWFDAAQAQQVEEAEDLGWPDLEHFRKSQKHGWYCHPHLSQYYFHISDYKRVIRGQQPQMTRAQYEAA